MVNSLYMKGGLILVALCLSISLTGCLHGQDDGGLTEQQLENKKDKITDSSTAIEVKVVATRSVNGTTEKHIVEAESRAANIGVYGTYKLLIDGRLKEKSDYDVLNYYISNISGYVVDIERTVISQNRSTEHNYIIRNSSVIREDLLTTTPPSKNASGETYTVELGNQTRWILHEYASEYDRLVNSAEVEDVVNGTTDEFELNASDELLSSFLNQVYMTSTGRNVLNISAEDIENSSARLKVPVYNPGGLRISVETEEWEVTAKTEATLPD